MTAGGTRCDRTRACHSKGRQRAALLSLMTPPLLPAALPERSIEELDEAIADLAARIHAATYEMLVLLREFDERAGWNNGFLSCAHWLQWRTGIAPGAAREKVRVAHALTTLPLTSGAFQRGEVSYAKVRALTRIATPDNERKLIDIAYCGTAAHVERLARAWRRCDRVEEGRRHVKRSVTCYVDDDGMVVLRARLTPELGAIVQQALEAALQRLYRERKEEAAPESIEEELTPAQCRADALGLMAEAALASDLHRGSASDRYQVVVHVDSASTGDERDAHNVLEVADSGVGVSAETSARLSCDASVVVLKEGADGSVLDVGRKTRTVPAAIRRALNARDRRCRFPGCAARQCDAHHITHWGEGGRTSLDNLVLLCRRHHRLVHEGGLTVERADTGEIGFARPNGRRIETSASMRATSSTLAYPAVGADSLRCWDGTPFRLGYVINVLRGHEPILSLGEN